MRVRWVIVARAIRKSKTSGGGLDIAGLFDTLNVERFPAKERLAVLACVESEPTDEINQEIEIRFQLARSEGGAFFEAFIPYKGPTYAEWLEGASPYVYILLDAVFPEQDAYSAVVGTIDKVMGRADFIVKLKDEDD